MKASYSLKKEHNSWNYFS